MFFCFIYIIFLLFCIAPSKGYFLPTVLLLLVRHIGSIFNMVGCSVAMESIDALEAQNMRSDGGGGGGTRAAKIVICAAASDGKVPILSYEQRRANTSCRNKRCYRKRMKGKADTTHGNKGQLEEDSSILRSPSSTDRKIFEGANHPADSEPSIVSQKQPKLTNNVLFDHSGLHIFVSILRCRV